MLAAARTRNRDQLAVLLRQQPRQRQLQMRHQARDTRQEYPPRGYATTTSTRFGVPQCAPHLPPCVACQLTPPTNQFPGPFRSRPGARALRHFPQWGLPGRHDEDIGSNKFKRLVILRWTVAHRHIHTPKAKFGDLKRCDLAHFHQSGLESVQRGRSITGTSHHEPVV